MGTVKKAPGMASWKALPTGHPEVRVYMCPLAAYRTFLVAISQRIEHAEYGECCVCEFYQE
jgi:hypothetical protein